MLISKVCLSNIMLIKRADCMWRIDGRFICSREILYYSRSLANLPNSSRSTVETVVGKYFICLHDGFAKPRSFGGDFNSVWAGRTTPSGLVRVASILGFIITSNPFLSQISELSYISLRFSDT
jgi:hypothetical protein